jgi:hypothetical protein
MAYSQSGRHISRRAWLVTGLVAVVAAGGGVASALLRPAAIDGRPPGPPDWLISAVDREQSLLRTTDAAIRADATLVTRLQPLRSDHTAHLQALQALLARYPANSTSGSAPTPFPTPASPGAAAVRAAEVAAARATATAARTVPGGTAGLLASIAACEATHVELLS